MNFYFLGKYFFSQMFHRLRQFSLFSIILVFFHCSKPFPEADLWEILLWTAGSQSSGREGSGDSDSSVDSRLFIFVTQGSYNGDLGGISGADTICRDEKNNNFSVLPGLGTNYKAILVEGIVRRACTTANCGGGVGENIDWVIAPNQEYFRSDGVKLFTSNSSGIVIGNMEEPISSNAGEEWWTGLADNWRSTDFDDCSSWTDDGTAFGSGTVGSANELGYLAWLKGELLVEDCNQSKKLICVRQ